MKKLINAGDSIIQQSLEGFAAAHFELVTLNPSPLYIRRKQLSDGKVAVISGGGSGHEPMHQGFVGKGMLDAACPGEIFTAPTPDQVIAAIEDCETGAGVLLLVKNYQGDLMNFEMAAEMVNCAVETLIIRDDASNPHRDDARGIAGTMVVEKMVGAAAESGVLLLPLKLLGEKVVNQTRSMGLALQGCTVPAVGSRTFDLEENQIEYGVGIHGERGTAVLPMAPADQLVEQLVQSVLAGFDSRPSSEVLLFVNGLGATPLGELYLVYNSARRLLEAEGINVSRSLVGSYATCLDMVGCSITVTFLDDELKEYWDSPVKTAAFSQGSNEH